MKKFIYLVQGDATRIGEYLHLRERPNADAVFLTYDRERAGCIFFPDSTWTQGRNRLLEETRAHKDYLYFVFMDDDVKFVRGDYGEFESLLIKLQPAAATPVFPNTRGECIGFGNPFGRWFHPLLEYQIFWHSDPQMIAYHRDVIRDGLALPLIESFDCESPGHAAHIHLSVLCSFYGTALLQFNNIAVSNDCHRPYPRNYNTSLPARWVSDQFIEGYKPFLKPDFQLRKFVQRSLLPIKSRYFKPDVPKGIIGPIVNLRKMLKETRDYHPRASYRVDPQIVSRQLSYDSQLYRNYLQYQID